MNINIFEVCVSEKIGTFSVVKKGLKLEMEKIALKVSILYTRQWAIEKKITHKTLLKQYFGFLMRLKILFSLQATSSCKNLKS